MRGISVTAKSVPDVPRDSIICPGSCAHSHKRAAVVAPAHAGQLPAPIGRGWVQNNWLCQGVSTKHKPAHIQLHCSLNTGTLGLHGPSSNLMQPPSNPPPAPPHNPASLPALVSIIHKSITLTPAHSGSPATPAICDAAKDFMTGMLGFRKMDRFGRACNAARGL